MLKRRKSKFTYTVDTLGGKELNGCVEMCADSEIYIMEQACEIQKNGACPKYDDAS